MRRRLLIVLVFAILFSQSFSLGVLAAPPSFPSVFYGTVTSEAYALGSHVLAYVQGVACGSAEVRDDPTHGLVYVIDVLPDDPETLWCDGGQAGDVVTFALESAQGVVTPLLQTGVWQGGATLKLDLEDRVQVVLPLIITR